MDSGTLQTFLTQLVECLDERAGGHKKEYECLSQPIDALYQALYTSYEPIAGDLVLPPPTDSINRTQKVLLMYIYARTRQQMTLGPVEQDRLQTLVQNCNMSTFPERLQAIQHLLRRRHIDQVPELFALAWPETRSGIVDLRSCVVVDRVDSQLAFKKLRSYLKSTTSPIVSSLLSLRPLLKLLVLNRVDTIDSSTSSYIKVRQWLYYFICNTNTLRVPINSHDVRPMVQFLCTYIIHTGLSNNTSAANGHGFDVNEVMKQLAGLDLQTMQLWLLSLDENVCQSSQRQTLQHRVQRKLAEAVRQQTMINS